MFCYKIFQFLYKNKIYYLKFLTKNIIMDMVKWEKYEKKCSRKDF